jgi:hypothetical protein
MKQECKDCNKSLDDCTCIEDTIDMKQETLEEAAERLHPEEWDWREREIFIAGAKWQQERSYSVEDLECAWNSSDQNMRFQFSSSAYKGITFKQWLEKYEHER